MNTFTGLKRRIGGVYYGWRIAAAGAVNMFVSSGPTFQASSTIFAAVEEEFGWSRGLTTGVASFGRFGGAMLGPLEGILTDRFGAARMVLVGFLIGGGGLILFSQITGPVTYYLAYLLLATGFSIGGFTPSMAAVNAWMPTRRAIAGAIVVGGSSAAGFAVPLLVWGISSYGWRPSMFFIGVVAMFIGPALFRVVSRRPPPTDRPRTAFSKSDLLRAGPARDFTGAEALRTRAFWAMALAHGLVNLSLAAVAAHIFQHLTGPEVGLGDLSAASIITLTAGFALVFQIGGGLVGDRLDKRIPVSVLMICQAGGMALLAFVGSYASAIVFAFVWSLGFGARTPMLHAMRGEYFGARHYGVILGFYSIPMSIGMMTAPVAVGVIFDIQDTYRWAFLGLSGACILGAILVLLATRPEPPAKLGATV